MNEALWVRSVGDVKDALVGFEAGRRTTEVNVRRGEVRDTAVVMFVVLPKVEA